MTEKAARGNGAVTMSANLNPNSSHGGHGVYGGKREEKRAKHILLCSLFIFHFSFLRVLRVRFFIVMLAHMG